MPNSTINRKDIEGDFQTPKSLADSMTKWLVSKKIAPEVVIEPTVGKGSLLKSAFETFGDKCTYYGYDINRSYIERLKKEFSSDVILEEFNILNRFPEVFDKENALFIANPPWIRSDKMSKLEGFNLPMKSNTDERGISALTGKGNFDISEYITNAIVNKISKSKSALLILLKSSVARKVLKNIWKNDNGPSETTIINIDAASNFGIAASACALWVDYRTASHEKTCAVYNTFEDDTPIQILATEDGILINDYDAYNKGKGYLAKDKNAVLWRSGVKHDAASIMKLKKENGVYKNGLGEIVNIEESRIFPYISASNLTKTKLEDKEEYMIMAQVSLQEKESDLFNQAPKTYEYLNSHLSYLQRRKSKIYNGKSKFAIFGLGEYTFKKYKIAISGFSKTPVFHFLEPRDNKPIVLDDISYFISFDDEMKAIGLFQYFNSNEIKLLIESMIFSDGKRPITAEILNRIGFV